jgi:hypothetical protein
MPDYSSSLVVAFNILYFVTPRTRDVGNLQNIIGETVEKP